MSVKINITDSMIVFEKKSSIWHNFSIKNILDIFAGYDNIFDSSLEKKKIEITIDKNINCYAIMQILNEIKKENPSEINISITTSSDIILYKSFEHVDLQGLEKNPENVNNYKIYLPFLINNNYNENIKTHFYNYNFAIFAYFLIKNNNISYDDIGNFKIIQYEYYDISNPPSGYVSEGSPCYVGIENYIDNKNYIKDILKAGPIYPAIYLIYLHKIITPKYDNLNKDCPLPSICKDITDDTKNFIKGFIKKNNKESFSYKIRDIEDSIKGIYGDDYSEKLNTFINKFIVNLNDASANKDYINDYIKNNNKIS
jgi:hypothetical protein